MADFYKKVYKIVRKIPHGKVLTYQDVAKLAGNPKASRAVGGAMKNNPDNNINPCHRVIGSDGKMHGFAFGGKTVKFEKLKKEGVVFVNKKVDLQISRWQSLHIKNKINILPLT